jgi:dihydrofolate reductase
VCDHDGKSDWVFKTGDAESKAWSVGIIKEAGLIAIGRKSFENMAPYWIKATDIFAGPMNEIPKAVFTQNGYKGLDTGADTSPAAISWANASVFHGDLADAINKLKAGEGKPITAIGGAGFMRSLIATGLVDEYHLAIHPVILGTGFPIFNDVGQQRYLKLLDVKVFPGGTAVHIYSK